MTTQCPTLPRFQVFSPQRQKVLRQGVAPKPDFRVVDTKTGKTVARFFKAFDATQASLALNNADRAAR